MTAAIGTHPHNQKISLVVATAVPPPPLPSAGAYRRANSLDLAGYPFDLPQILFYSETKDFR